MRIAVEAVALRSAGGLSVATNFLSTLREDSRGCDIDAFVPQNAGYKALESPQLRIHLVPAMFQKNWLRPMMDRLWLARRIAERRPDVVFAMGNMALPAQVKQVVLFHWPYAIYPESEAWKRMSWKDRLARRSRLRAFRRRLRYAEAVVTQTHTAARRLSSLFPGSYRTVVIPPAVSLIGRESANELRPDFGLPKKRIKLLCLTRYYPHKNLEVLLPLAEQVARQAQPFAIITTLSPDQHPGARRFLERVRTRRLETIIHNVGPVGMEEVPSLYRATDGLLLPTLLESFSGTYAEAMYWKRPIFTSDRDFARDVCGNCAFYFDPLSPESILDTVQEAFRDERLLADRVEQGHERVLRLPDWSAVADQYIDLFEEIVSGRGRMGIRAARSSRSWHRTTEGEE